MPLVRLSNHLTLLQKEWLRVLSAKPQARSRSSARNVKATATLWSIHRARHATLERQYIMYRLSAKSAKVLAPSGLRLNVNIALMGGRG